MVTTLLIVTNQIPSCARFSERQVGVSSKDFRKAIRLKKNVFFEFGKDCIHSAFLFFQDFL